MNRQVQALSKNQRFLFSLLAVESMQNVAPLSVSYKEEAGDSAIWSTASGFVHLLYAHNIGSNDKVFVCDDNNVTLMTICLPWHEIRAAKVQSPVLADDCLGQSLRLYRCRDYFSDRDLFTNEPKFWFEDAELVLEITIGGFFSEQLRNFVARFPDEGNAPLGDLASNK